MVALFAFSFTLSCAESLLVETTNTRKGILLSARARIRVRFILMNFLVLAEIRGMPLKYL
jgi:hypothetical protein